MIGIIGARGVGKTTMILQYIRENLDYKKALYVSADDMYFGENKLIDLAHEFYKSAGEYLFIDYQKELGAQGNFQRAVTHCCSCIYKWSSKKLRTKWSMGAY